MSVNLYMFHGGSSFGFMSGALTDPSYKALVPSYGWFSCVLLLCHKQTSCVFDANLLELYLLENIFHSHKQPAGGSRL